MSFLAPLFLLGTLTIALPVIFHLIRRTTRERTVFSSLMFLSPSPPRLTRRSRLEHLLLLALRCAGIGLLACGFARPLWRQAQETDPTPLLPKRRVVLVDRSASMRRDDLWTRARTKVETTLRQAGPNDQVAVFGFARQLLPVITLAQWTATPPGERVAVTLQRLAEAGPGWEATCLDTSLIQAAEALSEPQDNGAEAPGEIIVVSDLQEGSRLSLVQGYEWPKGIGVRLEPVRCARADNAGLQWVGEADDSAVLTNAVARIRVNNAADSKREQFRVGWLQPGGQEFSGPAVEVYVPPGQSRTVSLRAPPNLGEALDRVGLRGDSEPFDNTAFIVPIEPTRVRVLYVGAESGNDPSHPLYFLLRALQETPRQLVRVLPYPPTTPVPSEELRTAAWYVLAAPLADDRARQLGDQVALGKTLLVLLRDINQASTLARLIETDTLPLEEVRPASYAMLAEIDFRHPLFAPFADPRYSDFTPIHFWRYRRLQPSSMAAARILAKFDSGDPALLEVPVGRGRILVLTSGWHPQDSQFALSSKFVPLVHSLLESSGALPAAPGQYRIGEVVALPADATAPDVRPAIRTPEGTVITLDLGATNFSRTISPGVYALVSAQPPRRFAVNLDPQESLTAPLPLDELERLGVPGPQERITAGPTRRSLTAQAGEIESRQKLWRWFVAATLAVLLVESWLGGRAARRLPGPNAGSPAPAPSV